MHDWCWHAESAVSEERKLCSEGYIFWDQHSIVVVVFYLPRYIGNVSYAMICRCDRHFAF